MDTNYESDTFTDPFQHIASCPSSSVPIKQYLTIDDGTGKLFTYELQKDLTWKEYTITPNFSTDPIEPTIIDNTDIIPNIDDPYDVVGYKDKDQTHDNNDGDTLDDILPVDYDLFEDGTRTEKGEDETITEVLSVPREQHIKQTVRYFTGWEVKYVELEKVIQKTNIPPKACNELDASCYTVPVHYYTSCSTDQEDNPEDLTINWHLYKDNNSYVEISEDDDGNEVRTVVHDDDNLDWVEVATREGNPAFSYTYNDEGYYKLTEIAIDKDDAENNVDRLYDIVFKSCGSDTSEQDLMASGIIEVEANVWQLCAIPMVYGYWNKDTHKIAYNKDVRSTVKNVIIDQIEDVYGTEAKDLIIVINGYVGDENIYRNYVPGFTKDTSVHNFKLVYIDEDYDVDDDITKFEISGFWIKSKGTPFEIKWGVEK